MKTTMKLIATTSILTMGLATTTWASPRSKLSYEPNSNYPTAHGMGASSGHVWFKHIGPRSKM